MSMNNYETKRLELTCANRPTYVPGIPGQKGARSFISVFMNEDFQKNLKPGDPNYPVAVVINGFSGKNMEIGKTGPAEFIAGLSVGHIWRAELLVRVKREMVIHPDTKQPIMNTNGGQRYNAIEFRSLAGYFRYGKDAPKFIDQQISDKIRHYAWDSKIPVATLHGWLAEIRKVEPQGGVQTQLLTSLINACNEGMQHELQRRANDRTPYVPGAQTFRNAIVKQNAQNAYQPQGTGFVAQVAQAVNPVQQVQQGFTPPQMPQQPQQPVYPQTQGYVPPAQTQQAGPPPVITEPFMVPQGQMVANVDNGFPADGAY